MSLGILPSYGSSGSASSGSVDLTPYTLLTTTASVSGALNTRLVVTETKVDSSIIAFNTSVPFDYQYTMPQTAASVGLTFIPDATKLKALGSCFVRIVADGTNAPTFSRFYEHGSSSGYDNTTGIINNIMMWYDGLTFWYAVSQAVNAIPVTTPVIQSAIVNTTTRSLITLTYSQNLDTYGIPATSAFSITNSGIADAVSSITISGALALLTTTRAASGNEVLRLNYTVAPLGTNIRSSYGSVNVASLASYTVDTTFGNVFVKFNYLTPYIVQTGSASAGWSYTNTHNASNDFITSYAASASVSLPISADGSLFTTSTWPVSATDGYKATIVCLRSANTAVSYYDSTVICGVYSTLATYKTLTLGTGGGAIDNTGYVSASGDTIRLRRTSPNIYAEVSKDGGLNYTLIHTWTPSGTHPVGVACSGALYPYIASDFAHIIGPIRASGMV